MGNEEVIRLRFFVRRFGRYPHSGSKLQSLFYQRGYPSFLITFRGNLRHPQKATYRFTNHPYR